MTSTKTTFVTSFYDLGKIEGNASRRQSEQYYTNAIEILKRNIDLIFIGEEADTVKVWNIRRSYGFAERTFCLSLPFEKLPFYEKIPELAEIINEKGISNYSNDVRFTPQYLSLIWSKLFFLKRSAEMNPFEATHFCWLDFGYFHMRNEYNYLAPGQVGDDCFTNINASWKLQEPNAHRFRICLLNDYVQQDILDAKTYYSKDNYLMAATIMGGDSTAIDTVWEKLKKQIALSMRIRIPAAEENIIGRISYFFPELFDFTVGYYSTSLQNFAEVTMFPEMAIKIGAKWRESEKRQESYDVLSKLAEGVMSGRLHSDISNEEIYKVFYELIICAYYVHYQSYCKYRDFFRTWLREKNLEISPHLEMNMSF